MRETSNQQNFVMLKQRNFKIRKPIKNVFTLSIFFKVLREGYTENFLSKYNLTLISQCIFTLN